MAACLSLAYLPYLEKVDSLDKVLGWDPSTCESQRICNGQCMVCIHWCSSTSRANIAEVLQQRKDFKIKGNRLTPSTSDFYVSLRSGLGVLWCRFVRHAGVREAKESIRRLSLLKRKPVCVTLAWALYLCSLCRLQQDIFVTRLITVH